MSVIAPDRRESWLEPVPEIGQRREHRNRVRWAAHIALPEGAETSGEIYDIHPTGLFVVPQREFACRTGDKIQIQFRLPDSSMPHKVAGQVCWYGYSFEHERTGVGIEFIEPHRQVVEWLGRGDGPGPIWGEPTQEEHLTRPRQKAIESTAVRAQLIVLGGGPVGRGFTLRDELSLGRSTGSSVRIPDESVSRHHARIFLEDGGAWIEDLGSRNGTKVNGERVTRCALRNGDRVEIGTQAVFKFSNTDLLERQLQDAQRMESIGRLAAGIAHDFNNLLTIVSGGAGFVEMVLESTKDMPWSPTQEGKVKKVLGDIQAASDRAADLTQQLLSFARKGSRKEVIVPLSDLIAPVEALAEHTFPRNLNLRIDAEHNLAVLGDPKQLEQVLMNLLLNARDAMPDGGNIDVRANWKRVTASEARLSQGTLASSDYVYIEISDDGCGIDDSTLRRIFEPYFTTKEQGKGTGLGLAMVYGIVRSHGGHINVRSTVGSGTTFEIHLPAGIIAEEHETKTREFQRPSRGAGQTILLVDDEDMVRRTTRHLLEHMGYHVVEAEGGRAAVKALTIHGDEIDLVMLDVMMPDMDGAQTFSALRRLQPGVPVLFCSGYGLDRCPDEVRKQPFLAKPFRLKNLSDLLPTLLPPCEEEMV